MLKEPNWWLVILTAITVILTSITLFESEKKCELFPFLCDKCENQVAIKLEELEKLYQQSAQKLQEYENGEVKLKKDLEVIQMIHNSIINTKLPNCEKASQKLQKAQEIINKSLDMMKRDGIIRTHLEWLDECGPSSSGRGTIHVCFE